MYLIVAVTVTKVTVRIQYIICVGVSAIFIIIPASEALFYR